MVKKLISLISVFLLIISSGTAYGAAADVGAILSVKDFENGNNLSKPMVSEVEGNSAKVIFDSERNSNVLNVLRTKSFVYVQENVGYVPEKMIFGADMKFDSVGGEVLLFNLGKKHNVDLTEDMKIISYLSKKTLATVEKGKWYNISVVWDTVEKTFDLYIDYKKVNEKSEKINMPDDGEIASWRYYLSSGSGGNTEVFLDNMVIYSAETPHTLEEINEAKTLLDRKSAYYDNEDIEKNLTDSVALNIYSKVLYINGKRNKLSGEIIQNDKILLPVEEILTISEMKYSVAGQYIIVNNNSYKADLKSGGKIYLNSETLFKDVFKKNNIFKKGNLLVASKDVFRGSVAENLALETESFLTYERPEREQLREDFEKTTKKGEHPRLLIKEKDVDRMKEYISSGDEFMVKGFKAIKKTADYYLTKPPVEYALSGGQLLSKSRELLKKTQHLATCYLLTGEEKYAEATFKNLYSAASFPDWNHHTHYLDTGEMAAAFALGFDYIYDYLYENKTADEINHLKNAMKKFCLTPARASHYGSGLKYVNNWNSVVNGGIIMCAILFADEEGYEDIAFDIIEKSLKGLEYMMPAFVPDGAWEESSGYWSLMMNYCMRLMGSIESSFGTSYGLYDFEGFKNSGMFSFFVNGPTSIYNYHDSANSIPDFETFMWFAYAFDDEKYASLRFYNIDEHSPGITPFDLMFYRNTYEKGDINKIVSKDGYLRQVELISLRSDYSKNALYVGAHGGMGKVPHWNLDSGTFVIDAMGERFAAELGSDNYDLDGYINTKSHLYYRKRTEGQNCIVINPDESMGQVYEAFSPVTDFHSEDNGSYAVMDLSYAYAKNASGYKRGYMLSEGRQTITIRDEITLLKPDSTVYWFMHTDASVEFSSGEAVLTKNGKKLLMQYDVDGASASAVLLMDAQPLPTSPNPEGQSKNSAYKKIAIKVTGSGNVNITVRFLPYEKREDISVFTACSIDEFKITPALKPYVETINLKVGNSEIKKGANGVINGSVTVLNALPKIYEGRIYFAVFEGDSLSDIFIKPVKLQSGENIIDIEMKNPVNIKENTKINMFIFDNNLSNVSFKEEIL